MDVSIVISDSVLSFVAFYSAYRLFNYVTMSAKIAAIGILIIGLTSFIGFINHFGIKQTAPFGTFFGGVSNYLGVPFIGLAFATLIIRNKKVSYLLITLFVIIYVVFTYFYSFPILPTVLGGIAMFTIIGVSVSKMRENITFSMFGIMGAILILIAGLVIGTEGK